MRAVRRLATRSGRSRTGLFLAEGPQAVREAVASPALREFYATGEAAERHPEILQAAAASRVVPRLVTEAVLAAMADTVTPQGLLAVCAAVDVPLAAALDGAPRLVAVLDQVRDPGNAGTVIRAADAAGADAVLLTTASVDVHNPKCVRSSAGSLFHLPIAVGLGLPEAVDALRAAGLAVLAADGGGPVDLDDLLDDAARGHGPLAGPCAWVFGNEAHGLGPEAHELADAVVRAPIHGRAESLNLATAAAVCLYATARAHLRMGTHRRMGTV